MAAKKKAILRKPVRKIAKKVQKTGASKTLVIPRIQWKRLQICIEGIRPLIMNKFSNKKMRDIEDKGEGRAMTTKGARDFTQEMEEAVHRSIEGWPCMPAACFKHALVRAGDMVDGLKMVKLARVLFIDSPPEQVVKIYGKYECYESWIRLPNGTATMRWRPIFYEWACEFPVDYVENEITDEQVMGLASLAFELGGIGDGRPSSPKNRAMDFGRARLVDDIDSFKKSCRKPQMKAAS